MALFVRKITYTGGRFKGKSFIEDRLEMSPEYNEMAPERCYQSLKSAWAGCAAVQKWFNKARLDDYDPSHAEDAYNVKVSPLQVEFVDGKMIVVGG